MLNRGTILAVVAVIITGAAAMALIWKASGPAPLVPSTAPETGSGSPAAPPAATSDGEVPAPSADNAPTGFPPLERFDERLQEDFEARSVRAYRDSGADTIVTSFLDEQLLLWQLTPHEQRGTALARSMHEFAQRAMAQQGNDAWEDAGMDLARRFASALTDAAEQCTPGADVQTCWMCMVAPEATWHGELVGIGGDFVEFAFRTGLLSPETGLTVSTPMLRTIFLYRWFNAVTGVRPVEQSLTTNEYQAFLRWRIERAIGIPAARRHELAIAYAAAFPDESSPPNAETLALTADAAGVDPPLMTTEGER